MYESLKLERISFEEETNLITQLEVIVFRINHTSIKSNSMQLNNEQEQ